MYYSTHNTLNNNICIKLFYILIFLECESIYQVPCPPSLKQHNHYSCIEFTQLCDGARDCTNGEDEDKTTCMFYKGVSFSGS